MQFIHWTKIEIWASPSGKPECRGKCELWPLSAWSLGPSRCLLRPGLWGIYSASPLDFLSCKMGTLRPALPLSPDDQVPLEDIALKYLCGSVISRFGVWAQRYGELMKYCSPRGKRHCFFTVSVLKEWEKRWQRNRKAVQQRSMRMKTQELDSHWILESRWRARLFFPCFPSPSPVFLGKPRS